MKVATTDQSKVMLALRLGLRAALSACEHPDSLREQGAKRGCGACRAVVAITDALKEPNRRDAMLIKITIQDGIVQDVETSEPALVQIYDLDAEETEESAVSTFETVAQQVDFEKES